MTTGQPNSDPFINNPADSPAPELSEPGVTEDGRAKVALTMPVSTAAAALVEEGPSSLPSLRACGR